MKTRKLWSIALILCFVFSPSSHAVSLRETMEAATETHPSLESQAWRLKAAQERVEAVWMEYLPTFRVSYVHQSDWDPEAGHTFGHQFIVSLTLPLFDGGATYFSARSAQASANVAGYLLEQARLDLAVEAAQVYTAVLQARAIAGSYRELLAFYDRLQVRSLHAADRKRVESAKSEVLNKLQGTIETVEEAEIMFEDIVGRAPAPALEPIDNVALRIPERVEHALQIAAERSPRLLASREQIDAVIKKRESLAASTYSPKVHGYLSHGKSDDFSTESNGQTIGIKITLDLSPSQIAHSRAFRNDIEAAYSDRDTVVRDLQTAMKISYKRLGRFESEQHKWRKKRTAAARDLKTTFKGRHEDVTTALAAAEAFEGSVLGSWNADIKLLLAKIQILGTMGTLFEDVNTIVKDQRSYPGS